MSDSNVPKGQSRRRARRLCVGAAVAAVAFSFASPATGAAAANSAPPSQEAAQLAAFLHSLPADFVQHDRIAQGLIRALHAAWVRPRSPAPAGLHLEEYNLPSGTMPIDIKNGPDGNVWFTAPHVIGMIDPVSKQISLFPSPINAGTPYGLSGGPGPYVYFTTLSDSTNVVGNQIGRLNVYTHQYELFALPTPDAYPADLKTGPDGNIWFSEQRAGKIGMFDTRNNTIQEYDISAQSMPAGVATGEGSCLVFRQCDTAGSAGINTPGGPLAGGKIWYTLMGPVAGAVTAKQPVDQRLPVSPTGRPVRGANALLTIDPTTHALRHFPYPTPSAGVLDIDPGRTNHEVWWAENTGNKIGYIDTLTTHMTELRIPTPWARPFTIGAGPRNRPGYMFWTEEGTNAIGTYNLTTRRFGELLVPSPHAVLVDLTQNSRSDTMFFTEAVGDKIGEVVFS